MFEFESSAGLIRLRPIDEGDLGQCLKWRNEPELRQRVREYRPLTMADQQRWLTRISAPNRTDFMFMMETVAPRTAMDVPINPINPPLVSPPCKIGVVGLCHWSVRDRNAEISFYMGDQRFRRKGITRKALMELHRFGFNELGLHRIWAEVFEFNNASAALLSSLGYVTEGIMRESVYRNGMWSDSHILGLLKAEWEAQ